MLKSVTGTPATSPVAPALVRTDEVYQLCLAQVAVPAGSSVVGAITDTRANSGLCGLSNVTVGITPPSGNSASVITLGSANKVLYGVDNVDAALTVSAESLNTVKTDVTELGGLLSTITTTGTGAAYVANAVPGFRKIVGRCCTLKIHATSTSATATLNVNSTGASQVRWRNFALAVGQLELGTTVTVMWDGTYYQIIASDSASFAELKDPTAALYRLSGVNANVDAALAVCGRKKLTAMFNTLTDIVDNFIAFGTPYKDTSQFYDSSAPTRITIKDSTLAQLKILCRFNAGATINAGPGIIIYKNGNRLTNTELDSMSVSPWSSLIPNSGSNRSVSTSWAIDVALNDYLQIFKTGTSNSIYYIVFEEV